MNKVIKGVDDVAYLRYSFHRGLTEARSWYEKVGGSKASLSLVADRIQIHCELVGETGICSKRCYHLAWCEYLSLQIGYSRYPENA